MKRKDLYPKVKIIRPRIFWKRCDVCLEEFKNEDMYQVENLRVTNVACTDCVTDETINEFAKNPHTLISAARNKR